MQTKPTIIILASWYPSDEHPTYGSFVEEQALMWKNHGYDVLVIHAMLNGGFLDSLRRKLIPSTREDSRQGLRVIRLAVNVLLPFSRQLHYKRLYAHVANRLRKAFPSTSNLLIHSHAAFMGGAVAQYLHHKFNIPYIHTEHASALIFKPQQFTPGDHLALQQIYTQALKTVFVSQFALDKTRQALGLALQNGTVIPNLVKESFFTQPKTVVEPIFTCIGGLIPVKGQMLLIEAWPLVLAQIPDAKLVIAGEGQLKDDLLRQAQERGIHHHITWLPRLSRAETKAEMDKAAVIVSTSIVETFGLTLAEALACGKPVVCTDSGGPRDFVDDSCGRLVTERTPEALAHAIIDVWQNYAQFNPQTIQAYAQKTFSEETILRQLESFIP